MNYEEIDLCVVIPAFNEEGNLYTLVRKLKSHLNDAAIRYELLLVDDGSHDATPEIIREFSSKEANVRGLILSRNFGHQAAVTAGLQRARGAAIAVMDADLQDRPEDLVRLYRRWEDGADVVYAVRQNRPEALPKRLAYRLFYRLLTKIADIDMPVDAGDFCVMDNRFMERLNELPERLRYVRGLRAWLGGNQVPLPVQRGSRNSGRPKYTIAMLMKLALDGLISFSFKPLRLASYLGILVSGAAFLGAAVVLYWRARGLLPEGAGLATIALSVLFLGGIQLLTIGILGEYLGRVFQEVKQRPVAVVDEVVGESKRLPTQSSVDAPLPASRLSGQLSMPVATDQPSAE